MRRVIVPALLIAAFAAFTAPNASAGLFSKLCGNDCDSCCDIEPVCGCEIVEPACGCEMVDPCCDAAPACGPKFGLLKKLFGKRHACCDVEPACGCEVIEPACGCEMAAPVCGCEVAAPVCGCEVVDPCAPKCHRPLLGLFGKLFKKDCGCDACGLEPACGCEVIEPACGCEPTCGCGF